MTIDRLDSIEASLSAEEGDFGKWREYVDAGFPSEALRVRSFLRDLALLRKGPGAPLALMYLEMRLGDRAGTDRHAIQVLRILPESRDARQLLADDDRFSDLSSIAARLNQTSSRLRTLRKDLSAGVARPETALQEMRGLIAAEPRAFDVQREFFKVAAGLGDLAAVREMSETLRNQAIRLSDLGLRAGKAFEVCGDKQGALSMYVLGVVESPQSTEVTRNLIRFVQRHTALAATARERLEIMSRGTREPELVDKVMGQLAQVAQPTAADEVQAARRDDDMPTGDAALNSFAWYEWAIKLQTREAFTRAHREVQNLNPPPGLAEQLAKHIESAPAAATASVQPATLNAHQASAQAPLDPQRLPSALSAVANATDGNERAAKWALAAEAAKERQRVWLASLARGRAQGATITGAMDHLAEGESQRPSLQDVKLLCAARLDEEARWAWLACRPTVNVDTSTNRTTIVGHALELSGHFQLTEAEGESIGRFQLLTMVAVGTMDIDMAVERGIERELAEGLRGQMLCLEGDEQEGRRLLERSSLEAAIGFALLRREFGEAIKLARPWETLVAEFNAGLNLPKPRRVASTFDREIVEHSNVAWEAWELADKAEGEERRSRLEMAAFRYAVAGQSEVRGQHIMWYNEGVIELRLGRLDRAEQCLRRCLAPMARDAAAQWGWAICQSQLGHRQEAFQTCRHVLQLNHEHAEACLLAGVLAVADDQPATAFELLSSRVALLRPIAIELAVHVAHRLDSPESWQAAAKAFDPRPNPERLVGAGAKEARPPLTIPSMTEPTPRAERAPTPFEQIEGKCFALVEDGQGPEAIHAVDEQISAEPHSVQLRLLKQRILARLGQHEEAIEALLKLAKGVDDRRRAVVMKAVAECYVVAGDGKRAMSVIDRQVRPFRKDDDEVAELRREASRIAAMTTRTAAPHGALPLIVDPPQPDPEPEPVTEAPTETELPFEFRQLPSKPSGKELNQFYRRLAQEDRFDELVDCFEAVCRQNSPKFLTPQELLGRALLGAGRVDEGLEKLRQVAAGSNPEFADRAMGCYLQALVEHRRIDDAVERISTMDFSALRRKPSLNLELTKVMETLADLDQTGQASLAMADLLFGRGERERGADYLRDAFHSQPDNDKLKALAKRHKIQLRSKRMSASVLRGKWTRFYSHAAEGSRPSTSSGHKENMLRPQR